MMTSDAEMSEKCAQRRDVRAKRYDAPPVRCSGASMSTVPAMCTSGVRVVLLLDEEVRDAHTSSKPTMGWTAASRRPRGRPATSKTTRRFGCGLVPDNLSQASGSLLVFDLGA